MIVSFEVYFKNYDHFFLIIRLKDHDCLFFFFCFLISYGEIEIFHRAVVDIGADKTLKSRLDPRNLLQEALEVLRTTPSTVELVVCRLPGDTSVTPPGAPPPPPARREPPPPLRILNPLPPLQIEPCGVSNSYQRSLLVAIR